MRKRRFKIDPNEYTASISNLSNDGRGVARIDGKATFIQGALPEEEVRFQYTQSKKDFDEGRITTIVKASPLRVEPKCPHYNVCGGCSLQHLQESAQIHFKQDQLLELLQRFGHTKPQHILPSLTAEHWNYRNKARLSVRYVRKKNMALVGFRERNNPRLITEINQCPVLHTKVDGDILHFRQLIEALEDKESIAQIEVAAGDNQVGLILRNLRPLSSADETTIKTFAQRLDYKIYLQPQGPDSVYCFYPENASAYLSYALPDYTIDFDFHPCDFTQINASLNRQMVPLALKLMDLQSTDKVLDLFCGLGNFSLPMSKFCANVIGIEGNAAMVERAYHNANKNGLTNLRFEAANLDDVQAVKHIVQMDCNKILIDPPRSGALELVKQIEALKPQRIVYVSCNPVTLARDADVLVNQKGYSLHSAGVMDMFPHTAHVESIALFVEG